jgi:hypothetical protein
MLQKIISIYKQKQKNRRFQRNRSRFVNVHSDCRFINIESIFERLRNNDNTLTDDEIINTYKEYSSKIQSNTISVAELEFVTISSICFFKPQLMPILLRNGIHSLVMTFGHEVNAKDICLFINYNILNDEAEPYGGLPDEFGIEWLKNLMLHEEVIQKTLESVIIYNKQILDEL